MEIKRKAFYDYGKYGGGGVNSTLKKQLDNALEYALETGSFHKMNIIKKADAVCVFGLGVYFEEAFCIQNVKERFRVSLLCDNNTKRLKEVEKKLGKNSNLKCITPDQLPEYGNVAVILMLGDTRSAVQQLSQIIDPVNCIAYNDLVLDEIMNGKQERNWFKSEFENIRKGFSLIDSQKSQQIYVNVLCNRIAPHLSAQSYEEMCVLPQYFYEHEGYRLNHDEVLIDCGAYTGDTLEIFLRHQKTKNFSRIYAFEMDKDNYHTLDRWIREQEISERIVAYNAGVWNKNEICSYGKMSSSDSFSIFNPRDTIMSNMIRLDDVLGDKRVTLLKMDIEGAEKEALEGAENIIKTQTPKLAICVYHRIEDLWTIPIMLKEWVPEYSISIRHHAKWWVSETVCYAWKNTQ
ncbi:MAG: FkbM family methyltransferase [Dorea sp.]|nr:FkbM family methyltransferase [Dorea sp.]